MKRPDMILFDYGQTLINENRFDGLKGTAAVLEYATENKYKRTPEELQALANEINTGLGRMDASKRHLFQIEIPYTTFSAYLYESQGIRFSLPYEELETVFWDAASPGVPTEGIAEFLEFLHEQGIRTGVISNMSYTGKSLTRRITAQIPNHHFEFILSSCDYVFRKPNPRIFQLALEKAGLLPEQVWYVGDQYECDIVGAKAVGMTPVWYTAAMDFAQDTNREVLKINHWDELRSLLLEAT